VHIKSPFRIALVALAELWHKQHMEEEAGSHEKERSALKIILQSKMRVCVDAILAGVSELAERGVEVPSKVGRQARALQSLIGATVQAIGGADEG
jgi:hypothetical protein